MAPTTVMRTHGAGARLNIANLICSRTLFAIFFLHKIASTLIKKM
jgi:hypothetical protein